MGGRNVTDTRDDFLIRLSASRHPVENILVQFSVLSLVIMIILGVVISVILTTRLNRDFEILKPIFPRWNPVLS